MVRQIILVLAVFLVAGCGGYALPQAVTRIEFASISEADAARQTIQNELQEREFQLQPHSPFPEELTGEWPPALRWRDQHEISLVLNRSGGEDLVAYVTPFPSAETFGDATEQSHFPIVELRLVEERPGGFSPDGHRIYAELLSILRQQGYRLVVISEPPPTDDEEYGRVKFEGLATFVLWWLVAWTFGAVTLGTPANWLATRLRMKQALRRVIFVVVGTALVTPLPYPAATIFVILLPGLLWLTSDPATYAKFMFEMAVWVVVSGALSVVVAILLIRDRKRAPPAQRELAQ